MPTRMTGPLMDAQTLNQFLYSIHYKVEAMEKWAGSVNDAVTDHADRIDLSKARSFQAFTIVKSQMEELRKTGATNESDTRQVMGLIQANDEPSRHAVTV